MIWVQWHSKDKSFLIGDYVLWFLKDKKTHIDKLKKGSFGTYKIWYYFPNNIMLLVRMDKFGPKPILVNIN
jgi:hypothetical protein